MFPIRAQTVLMFLFVYFRFQFACSFGLRENLTIVNLKSLVQKKIKTTILWQAIFSVIGLITSLYLFIHHTRLESGIQESASFCSFGKFMDCDTVNVSRYSEVFGVPIAALGAIYFCVLLIMGIMVSAQDKSFSTLQRLMAWLTGMATIYNLILLFGIQLFVLKSLCIMCFLTYVCTTGHLILNIRLAGAESETFKEKLITAFGKPHMPLLKTIPIMRWGVAVVSLVLFSLVITFLPYFIRRNSSENNFVQNSIQQFYGQWKELPQKKLPVSPGDGTWGNPSSPIQIVEFSDFQCPWCRKAAFPIHTILKLFQKRIFFIFKNFPLDSTCNPNLPLRLHPHACKLARLAACAQIKGKFWDYHDQAFLRMTDEDIEQGFDHIAEILRPVFSTQEISSCLSDPKTQKPITENINLGVELKIKATPSVFINGKLITIPITVESLEQLITLEESLFK